jgi:hypothetical protein
MQESKTRHKLPVTVAGNNGLHDIPHAQKTRPKSRQEKKPKPKSSKEKTPPKIPKTKEPSTHHQPTKKPHTPEQLYQTKVLWIPDTEK